MLKQRTLTALILAPLAIALILLAPTALFALVMAAMSLQALWEWSRLAGLAPPGARVALIGANALLLALLWTQRNDIVDHWVIGAGLAWWVAAMFWLRHYTCAAAPTRANCALKLLAGELAVLPAWLALMRLHEGADHGRWWALLAVVLVWAADTGAYFAGKRFGTTRLAPHISPNKTTAGAWGGLAVGALVALAGGWLLGERNGALVAVLVLAVLTVAASILGDLVESLLKRQANVKDSGAIFPGHGGLLDRLDSVFAAIPAFVAGKALLDLFAR